MAAVPKMDPSYYRVSNFHKPKENETCIQLVNTLYQLSSTGRNPLARAKVTLCSKISPPPAVAEKAAAPSADALAATRR